MSRGILLLSLSAALLLPACGDSGTSPARAPAAGRAAVVDARTGPASQRNPHFFWLPPLLPQPAHGQLGRFLSQASPRVVLVCQATDQGTPGCDGRTPVAQFARGSGLQLDSDHFGVDLDTRAYPLSASTPGGPSTTYRIQVFTDPLAEMGGPFLLGYADIQLGETGKAAGALTTGDIIGVQSGRTLPIKFRIDAGAYEFALAHRPVSPGEAGEPVCQVNCSVTFVPSGATTTAVLAENGVPVTAMQVQPGDVAQSSVLVIDERTTAGADATCAPGVPGQKKYCYRYLVSPDVPFVHPVRFGICPRELPDDAAHWDILKVDYTSGYPVLSRPPEADVSDFLPCAPPLSLVQRAVRYALDWLAPPLLADVTPRPWGGMAGDLSDLYWGTGVNVRVTPRIASVPIGGTVQLSARVFDDDSVDIPGATVQWASRDASRAVVNASGRVTGIGAGTVGIVAQVAGVLDTAAVTVLPALTRPDLVVSSVTLSASRADPGQSIDVTYTVSNLAGEGPAGTSTFPVAIYLSADSDRFGGFQPVGGSSTWSEHIGLNWSKTDTRSISLPSYLAPGVFYVTVVVDGMSAPPGATSAVEELNEYNNARAALNPIVVPLLPVLPDQANVTPGTDFFTCPSDGTPLYQSFTPVRSSLVAVGLDVIARTTFPAAGTTATVRIRKGSWAGPVVAERSAFIAPPRPVGLGMLGFYFADPVTVTPGELYVIEGVVPYFGWYSTGNLYPGGIMIGCGGGDVPEYDLGFVTFTR